MRRARPRRKRRIVRQDLRSFAAQNHGRSGESEVKAYQKTDCVIDES